MIVLAKIIIQEVPMMNDDFENDMYHRCRWCKYFEKGRCYRGFASSVVSNTVYEVAEGGRVIWSY